MFTKEQLYSSMGKKRSTSLFTQTCKQGQVPILSLTSTEVTDYPSVRNLFLALVKDDPSEATFALTVFGEVNFWQSMQSNSRLFPYFEEYRRTTDILRKSEAFKLITQEVQSQGKNSYAAAKFLIDEPWKKTKADRQQAKETTEAATETTTFSDDLKRLEAQGFSFGRASEGSLQ